MLLFCLKNQVFPCIMCIILETTQSLPWPFIIIIVTFVRNLPIEFYEWNNSQFLMNLGFRNLMNETHTILANHKWLNISYLLNQHLYRKIDLGQLVYYIKFKNYPGGRFIGKRKYNLKTSSPHSQIMSSRTTLNKKNSQKISVYTHTHQLAWKSSAC